MVNKSSEANPENVYFESARDVFVMRAQVLMGFYQEMLQESTREMIACGSSAPNKHLALLLGIEAANVPWDIGQPSISDDLMSAAHRISKNEPGPVYAEEVARMKLDNLVEAAEETGSEIDFLTVGDVAIVVKVGTQIVKDVKKPDDEADLAEYIKQLFIKGKQTLPRKEKVASGPPTTFINKLEIVYDAATGWAKKQMDMKGSLEWRKLLVKQRMLVNFNETAVEHLSEIENTKNFVKFYREKRKLLVSQISEDYPGIPAEIIGKILGPGLQKCAGAIPIEYLIWYLMEQATTASKELTKDLTSLPRDEHRKLISASRIEIEMILPKKVKIDGVMDQSGNNSIVFNAETVSTLPLTNILQYIVSHVHNYPVESIIEAFEFFGSSKGGGFGQTTERQITPRKYQCKWKEEVNLHTSRDELELVAI